MGWKSIRCVVINATSSVEVEFGRCAGPSIPTFGTTSILLHCTACSGSDSYTVVSCAHECQRSIGPWTHITAYPNRIDYFFGATGTGLPIMRAP